MNNIGFMFNRLNWFHKWWNGNLSWSSHTSVYGSDCYCHWPIVPIILYCNIHWIRAEGSCTQLIRHSHTHTDDVTLVLALHVCLSSYITMICRWPTCLPFTNLYITRSHHLLPLISIQFSFFSATNIYLSNNN